MFRLAILALFANCAFGKDVSSDSIVPSPNIVTDDVNWEETLEMERKIQIAQVYISSLSKERKSWVDPFDMMDISKSNDLKSGLYLSARSDSFEPKHSCVLDKIFVTRWLKMLMLKISEDLEANAMNIMIDTEMVEGLNKLIADESIEIANLDKVITQIIYSATITRKHSFDLMDSLTFIKDKYFQPFVYVCLIIFVVYGLYISFLTHPLITISLSFFSVSVFWHWLHLYYQKLAQKHAEMSSLSIPAECRKHDWSIVESAREYVKGLFVTSDCSKYYVAQMVNPIWEISPIMALSETVSSAMFQPLSALSRLVNVAAKQLFDGLPLIHTVMVMILVVPILILLLIMIFNYKLKFPFFMGGLEPSRPVARSHVEEVKPLSSLCNAAVQCCRKVQGAIQSGGVREENAEIYLEHREHSASVSCKQRLHVVELVKDSNPAITSSNDKTNKESSNVEFVKHLSCFGSTSNYQRPPVAHIDEKTVESHFELQNTDQKLKSDKLEGSSTPTKKCPSDSNTLIQSRDPEVCFSNVSKCYTSPILDEDEKEISASVFSEGIKENKPVKNSIHADVGSCNSEEISKESVTNEISRGAVYEGFKSLESEDTKSDKNQQEMCDFVNERAANIDMSGVGPLMATINCTPTEAGENDGFTEEDTTEWTLISHENIDGPNKGYMFKIEDGDLS